MKPQFLLILLTLISLISCNEKFTTQVADNTFVYNDKVYKIVDNELVELADLESKNIRKIEVLKPKQKSLGKYELSYVKRDATATLNTLYRGNTLYYKLEIQDFNNLKDDFYPGKFTLEFQDDYGYILSSADVLTSDLIGMIDDDGKVKQYIYNGKVEMSTDISSEIKSFSVSSTVKHK